MLGATLSGSVGAIQFVVNLTTNWPASLMAAHLWIPPVWVWFVVALLLLTFAQFRMWMDEYEGRVNDKEGSRNQADGDRRELESKERDWANERARMDDRRLSREREVIEVKAKLGRPHVTLTFREVDYTHEFGTPGVPYEEWTEFVATCSDRDAFGVYIYPAKIGAMTLQSRVPVAKIAQGESRKMEYCLIYYSKERDRDEVNLEFRGRLRRLLDKTLRDSGEEYLRIPIRVCYTDVSAEAHETTMDLVYYPGVPETPMMEIPRRPRLSPITEAQTHGQTTGG